MNWQQMRRSIAWLMGILAAVAVVGSAFIASGGGAVAQAASAAPAERIVPARAATFIATKVILPETSIDGPALSSVTGTFEGQSSNESAIAWTGTDPAHHLNVETSKDGLHFSNKLILRETSPFRPDVTLIGAPAGLGVTMAWTGSDVNHSLNLLVDVYRTSGVNLQKLTLFNENSFTAPAVLLVTGQGRITFFLAWTGTNANHSLNILPVVFTGTSLVVGRKTVLSAFSSNAGPHLAKRGSDIVLNWTSRTGHLMVATSSDGVHFPTVFTSVQASAFAPSTVSFSLQGGPGAGDWMGWTGADTSHHLNLQFTSSFPSFPLAATKTVLSDTALGGPVLAFIGFPQIAWTGTDSAHHLNIARFLMQ